MDLIEIRSQDKRVLTKYDFLSVEKCGELIDYRIFAHIGDIKIYLGIYKNEERALEVLDEIQEILMPKCIINPKSMKLSKPYEENGMILMDCNADARLEQLLTYVYEMPKE